MITLPSDTPFNNITPPGHPRRRETVAENIARNCAGRPPRELSEAEQAAEIERLADIAHTMDRSSKFNAAVLLLLADINRKGGGA